MNKERVSLTNYCFSTWRGVDIGRTCGRVDDSRYLAPDNDKSFIASASLPLQASRQTLLVNTQREFITFDRLHLILTVSPFIETLRFGITVLDRIIRLSSDLGLLLTLP